MPFLTRDPLSRVPGAPPLQATRSTLKCTIVQLHTLAFAGAVPKAAGQSPAHRWLCTGLEKAQEIGLCLWVINYISLCFAQRSTALILTSGVPTPALMVVSSSSGEQAGDAAALGAGGFPPAWLSSNSPL